MGEQSILMRKGLDKLYTSLLISVMIMICAILAFIPILGLLAMVAMLVGSLVSLVFEIQGILKLKQVDGRYTTVLILYVVNFLCGLFDDLAFMDLVETVLSLAAMWILINTTNEYLEQVGRSDVAAKGRRVLAINIGLSVASVVISALSLMADSTWDLGVLAVSAGVFAVLTLVLGLVTLVLYISYLGNARDSF